MLSGNDKQELLGDIGFTARSSSERLSLLFSGKNNCALTFLGTFAFGRIKLELSLLALV